MLQNFALISSAWIARYASGFPKNRLSFNLHFFRPVDMMKGRPWRMMTSAMFLVPLNIHVCLPAS